MQSTKKNKTKITLLSIMSVLVVAILVLSGVGIYFKLNQKESPAGEVNPLDFSIDTWDGTVSASGFNENYAGRGSETKTINSASSFVHFINEVNNGNSFEGKKIYLNSSIDLNGQEIPAIGTASNPFKGTFDGGYYTIYNAKINGNGLFGNTENATIKNIGLYNADTNLVDKAVNTNIENTFVRFGEGNLANEYVSNNGTHYIKNSFVHSTANGLINKLNTNNSSENEVEISNCYFTNGEEAIVEKVGDVFTTEENLIKATNKKDFATWSYSEEYSSDKAWCDYDYLKGSKKLDFTYPLQTGFVKVYLTGSCYESVVIAGSKIVDATNMAEAFDIADQETEAEVNLLVEKIFMEASASLENNSVVKVNAVEDTTIIRGENNNDSMFIGMGRSKIVLGSESTARSSQPTITLDGNSQSNGESNALVMVLGSKAEINSNVTLKNNTNNTTNYGGAVMLYNTESQAKINAKIENCYAENGGAIAVVGKSPASYGTIENCSAVRGGAVYMTDELPSEDVAAINARYGIKLNIKPTTDYTTQQTFSTISSDDTFTGCTAEKGGAIYISSDLTISGNPTFTNNHATSAGGAIYYEYQGSLNTITISGNPVFDSNYSEDGHGGAIYASYYFTISGSPRFENNYSLYGNGGAIYSPQEITIKDNGDTQTVESAKFIGNWAYHYEGVAGGAIWASSTVSIGGDAYFEDNFIVWPDTGAGSGIIHTDGVLSISGTTTIIASTRSSFYLDQDPNSEGDIVISGSVTSNLELSYQVSVSGTATLDTTLSSYYVNTYGTPTFKDTVSGGYITLEGTPTFDNCYVNVKSSGTLDVKSNFTYVGSSYAIYLNSNTYITLNTSLNDIYPVYKSGIAAYDSSNESATSYICYYPTSSYVSNATTLKPFFVTNMPSGCILDYNTKSNYGVVATGTSEDSIEISPTEVSACPGDTISIRAVSIGGFSVDSVETNSIVSYTGGTSLSSGFQTLTFKALAEGTDTITIVLAEGTTHSFDITFNIAYPTDKLYAVKKSVSVYKGVSFSDLYVHVPDQYLSGSIVLSSSDNNVVSTTTSSNIAIETDYFSISQYLTSRDVGTATISVSLYSSDGTLINTERISASCVESSWCTPGYIEVPVGGDINVILNSGIYDGGVYGISSSDTSVVTATSPDGFIDGENLSSYLEAVGVGTATIYLSGVDYTLSEDEYSVSDCFIVNVYDPATRVVLSPTSTNVDINEDILVTATIPETYAYGSIMISSSDSSIVEVSTTDALSVETIGHSVNLKDYLTAKAYGSATITISLYHYPGGQIFVSSSTLSVTVEAAKFTFSANEVTTSVGGTVDVTLTNTTGDYYWFYITSSNSSVVSVSGESYDPDGGTFHTGMATGESSSLSSYLTAVGEGEAIITVKPVSSYETYSYSRSFKVIVTAPLITIIDGWDGDCLYPAGAEALYTIIKSEMDNVYVHVRADNYDGAYTVEDPTIAEIGGKERHFKLNAGEMESLSKYVTESNGGTKIYLDAYCADDGSTQTISFDIGWTKSLGLTVSHSSVIVDMSETIPVTVTGTDSVYVEIISTNTDVVRVKAEELTFSSWGTNSSGEYYTYHMSVNSGDTFNLSDYLEIVGTGSATVVLSQRHMSSDPMAATGFEIKVVDKTRELFLSNETETLYYAGATVETTANIPTYYSDATIKVSSSDSTIVEVSNTDYMTASSLSENFLSSILTTKAAGKATITVDLYEAGSGSTLLQSVSLVVTIKESSYFSPSYIEVLVGEAINVVFFGVGDGGMSLDSSSDSNVVKILDTSISTGNISSSLQAVGVGTAIIYASGADYSKSEEDYIADGGYGVTDFFVVKVLDPTKELILSTTALDVYVGDPVGIAAAMPSAYPNAVLKISSSASDIVEVTDSGFLTPINSTVEFSKYLNAKALGSATIKVELYESSTGSVLQRKNFVVKVREIATWISPRYIETYIGGTINVNITTPSDSCSSTLYGLSSSDPNVVSINDPSSYHYMDSIKESLNIVGVGITVISFDVYDYSNDETIPGMFTVRVLDPNESLILTSTKSYVGDGLNLTASVPEKYSSSAIKISSSDSEIVMVTNSDFIDVEELSFSLTDYAFAKAAGTAKITVDLYSKSGSTYTLVDSRTISMVVEEPWYTFEEKEVIAVVGGTISAEMTAKGYYWVHISSSNESVVSVSTETSTDPDAQGEFHFIIYEDSVDVGSYLTAVGVGEAIITLTTMNYGEQNTATLKIIVVEKLLELSTNDYSTIEGNEIDVTISALKTSATYVALSSSNTSAVSIKSPTLGVYNELDRHFVITSSSSVSLSDYLTAVGSGVATITIDAYNAEEGTSHKLTLSINIVEDVVTVSDTYPVVLVGNSVNVDVTISVYGYINLTSSDSNVVKIDNSEMYGSDPCTWNIGDYVSAVGIGTATITFEVQNNEASYNYTKVGLIISVVEDLDDAFSISLNSNYHFVGGNLTGTVNVPKEHTTGAVKFTTSNSDVISINAPSNGYFEVANLGHKFALAANESLNIPGLVISGSGNAKITAQLFENSTGTNLIATRTFQIQVWNETLLTFSDTYYETRVGSAIDINVTRGNSYINSLSLSSSDESVVKANASMSLSSSAVSLMNYLTPVGVGTATITFAGNYYLEGISFATSITIVVGEQIASISETSISIQTGDSVFVDVTAVKANSTYFTLSSSNTSAVSVVSPTLNGKHFMLNLNETKSLADYLVVSGTGSANISIEAVCGEETQTLTLSIYVASPVLEVSSKDLVVVLGSAVNLSVTALDTNHYVEIYSSDESVVSVAEMGYTNENWGDYKYHFTFDDSATVSLSTYLTALKVGTTIITLKTMHYVSDPGPSTMIKITVIEEPIIELDKTSVAVEIEQSIDVSVKAIYENSTYVSISSSDTSVVSVASATLGEFGGANRHFVLDLNASKSIAEYLTANKAGTVTITISAYSAGEALSQTLTFTVTVSPKKLATPVINSQWTANVNNYLTVSSWSACELDSAVGYEIQLYKDGVAYGNSFITTETQYDFYSLMSEVGEYTYTVKVVSPDSTRYEDSAVSAMSTAAYTRQIRISLGTNVKSVKNTSGDVTTLILIQGESANLEATFAEDYELNTWSASDSVLTISANTSKTQITLSAGSTSASEIVLSVTAKYQTVTVTFMSNNVEYGTVVSSIEANLNDSVSVAEDGTMTIGTQTITPIPTTDTDQYDYAFSGWKGLVDIITKETMFVANFTRTLKQYQISISVNNSTYGKLLKADGSELTTTVVASYGAEISFKGNILTIGDTVITAQPSDTTNEFVYGFDKWEGSIFSTVGGDVELNAVFTRETNYHTVKFVASNDEYGYVSIEEISVPYNTAIVLNENNSLTIGDHTITATAYTSDEFVYTFTGWTNHTGNVTEPRTITANFSVDARTYEVSILTNPTSSGIISQTSVTVVYGSEISYVEGSKTITIGNETVVAEDVELDGADIGYKYVFKSWSVASGTRVERNMAIVAVFEKVAIEYSITYLNLQGVTLNNPAKYTVATETFTLTNPTHENYVFKGWKEEGKELSTNVTIEKGSIGERTFTAVWSVIITVETAGVADENELAINVYDSTSSTTPVITSTESFELTPGETYTIKVSSKLTSNADANDYQILRIKFDGTAQPNIYSPVTTVINSTIYSGEMTMPHTISLEYINAYMMKVNVPEKSISSLVVNTINSDENVIISYSSASAYIISKGTSVSFSVDSTPNASATDKHTFIGFTYIKDGVSSTIGVSGGDAITRDGFTHNVDYTSDSDVGTYSYTISSDVEISELTINTIVTKVVTVVISAIPEGQSITLESEHGLNKVIDADTPSVMLYSGEWKVTAGSLTQAQLEQVFPSPYTVTLVGGTYVITVP